MIASRRKVLYMLLSSGVLMLAWLTLLNLVLLAPDAPVLERCVRIGGSAGGLIGLVAGYYTMANFPIARLGPRVWLSTGLLVGCLSLVAVLIVDGNFPGVVLDQGAATAVWTAYVFACPVLVAFALLIELWFPATKSHGNGS